MIHSVCIFASVLLSLNPVSTLHKVQLGSSGWSAATPVIQYNYIVGQTNGIDQSYDDSVGIVSDGAYARVDAMGNKWLPYSDAGYVIDGSITRSYTWHAPYPGMQGMDITVFKSSSAYGAMDSQGTIGSSTISSPYSGSDTSLTPTGWTKLSDEVAVVISAPGATVAFDTFHVAAISKVINTHIDTRIGAYFKP